MSLDRYVGASGRIETDDLDWSLAREAGLTPEERFILTYFSDIESQTILYMRALLQTTAIQEPETIGFLSMWNYEEYFHGQALARLLEVCGEPIEDRRIARVRRRANLTETLKTLGGRIVSKICRNDFPALQDTRPMTGYLSRKQN